MTKTLDLAYDNYKGTTVSPTNWKLQKSGRPPYDAPAHDGAVQYMKKKGWWRAEDQAWQDARLARLNAVLKAWDNSQDAFAESRAAEKAEGNKVGTDNWVDYWSDYRAQNL
jgi:hypothetical protein